MRDYWLRILGAYILLQLAARMMKSAERVLQAASDTPKVIDSTGSAVVEGMAVK